jgi:hypothetical protein
LRIGRGDVVGRAIPDTRRGYVVGEAFRKAALSNTPYISIKPNFSNMYTSSLCTLEILSKSLYQ